jgi:hypothetical protein
MHVEQRFLPRAISSRPPMLQFYHIVSVTGPRFRHIHQSGRGTILAEGWRPYCVYVKGPRGTELQICESGPGYDIITMPDGPEFDEDGLARDLIRRLSPEGASVCDPFMCEGAVSGAALEVGRTYIGIEKETTSFLLAMNTLHDNS